MPKTPLQFAEMLRTLHYEIASHEDSEIAGGVLYQDTRAALHGAIALAFPGLSAALIIDQLIDNGESVAYNAKLVSERASWDKAEEIVSGLEENLWETSAEAGEGSTVILVAKFKISGHVMTIVIKDGVPQIER